MKRLLTLVAIGVTAIGFAACGGAQSNTTTNTNTNANANKTAAPAAPTKEALVELEKKAFEAWKNKDGKYFEGFLSDGFVSFNGGKRTGKADEVKMITDAPCEVKSSALSEESMISLGSDAAILVAKAAVEATCEGKKVPSPVRLATVFVRSGDGWKAAYHSEVPIVDPKDFKMPAAKKEAPVDAKPDALTEALLSIEKSGWEAWKARDQKKLEEISTASISFVDLMGNFYGKKEDVMKAWFGPKCEVKSTELSGAMGSNLAPNVAILTFKGTADGTCDGQPLGSLFSSSVFIKEGDAWKLAFYVENPPV